MTMAEHKGIISGIGNVATRQNEITPDSIAALRYFIIGHEYGVLDGGGTFNPEIIGENRIKFGEGLVYAYGYIGKLSQPTILTVNLGAIPQYYFAYVELDRSVIPNVCSIKLKNNQNSPYMNEYTFRQDQLSSVKTGIHQTPICLLRTSVERGIEIVENYITEKGRPYNPTSRLETVYFQRIARVKNCRNAARVVGSIADGASLNVYKTTVGDNLACTKYVDTRVSEEVNRSEM